MSVELTLDGENPSPEALSVLIAKYEEIYGTHGINMPALSFF